MLGKDIQLTTRRSLLLYKVSGDCTLLVLNGTLLNSISALLESQLKILLSTTFCGV